MVTLEVTIDTRHEDVVHDAQMDFYGRLLATCSSDSSLKIFEVSGETQNLIVDLKEHQGPIWQVSWSHPQFGSLLASCGYDKKLILYGIVNGQWRKLKEIISHDSSVNSVAWAPPEYGCMLACGSSDGTISIVTIQTDGNYDCKKITDAHSIGVNAVHWAPVTLNDESPGSVGVVRRLVSGGCDNEVRIWRETVPGRWSEETTLKGHTDWVRDVAWCPIALSNQQMIASCDQTGVVNIWTKSNDTVGSDWQRTCLKTFSQIVWHLSWSVTGDVLAVSCGDNKITLWKQNLENQWTCISDINQGEGDVSTVDE